MAERTKKPVLGSLSALCTVVALPVIFSFAACSPNEPVDEPATSIDRISFTVQNFRVADDNPQTRTSLQDGNFIWAAGDTVGIYPNTGAQVYFAMESGAGTSAAVFDGGGWAFKSSATYYSYYPFIGNIYLDRHRIPVNYTGQKQTGTTGVSHIGPYAYMYTPATSLVDGNLSFSYTHLGCLIRVNLTLPVGNYTKLAITAPTKAFVKTGWFDLQSSSPAIVASGYTNQLTIDLENVTSDGSTPFYVYLMSAPVNLKGTEITVSVLNDKKKELQCKKTPSKDYAAAFTYGLGCSSWTEVAQSMGLILDDWDDGGSIGGDAE